MYAFEKLIQIRNFKIIFSNASTSNRPCLGRFQVDIAVAFNVVQIQGLFSKRYSKGLSNLKIHLKNTRCKHSDFADVTKTNLLIL